MDLLGSSSQSKLSLEQNAINDSDFFEMTARQRGEGCKHDVEVAPTWDACIRCALDKRPSVRYQPGRHRRTFAHPVLHFVAIVRVCPSADRLRSRRGPYDTHSAY